MYVRDVQKYPYCMPTKDIWTISQNYRRTGLGAHAKNRPIGLRWGSPYTYYHPLVHVAYLCTKQFIQMHEIVHATMHAKQPIYETKLHAEI